MYVQLCCKHARSPFAWTQTEHSLRAAALFRMVMIGWLAVWEQEMWATCAAAYFLAVEGPRPLQWPRLVVMLPTCRQRAQLQTPCLGRCAAAGCP